MEREFSKQLSLWWSDGQHDDWFWRTAGSGGRATNRGKKGQSTVNAAGDIGAMCGEAQRLLNIVTIECKRGYNKTDIQELLDHKGKSQFREFIKQSKRSASLAGTPYYWLVIQRDRRHRLMYTNSLYHAQAPRIEHLDAMGGILVRADDFFLDPLLKAYYRDLANQFDNGGGVR
jgi:hypothetical protein